MNKKTALENLVFNTGLSVKKFSEKIGVNYRTFNNQYYEQKHNHIQFACNYGRILGVDTIQGYQDGAHFEITFKIKDIEVVGVEDV